MRILLAASTMIAVCATAAPIIVDAAEQLGPFVRIEAEKAVSLTPRCDRAGDKLDCAFAALTVFLKAENGTCRIVTSSYRMTFSRKGPGRWLSIEDDRANCGLHTEFSIETKGDSGLATGARLLIESEFRDTSAQCAKAVMQGGKKKSQSILEFNEKNAVVFPVGCKQFSFTAFPGTLPFLK